MDAESESFSRRLRRLAIGRARDPYDPKTFHHISLIAFFAWVGLGADGLSSSCYGPSEAFLTLGNYPHLAIFVALGTVFTIAIISTSYSQIIQLFPTGGGGYLVASHLLSPTVGMISGCALLIDYVLTISLSIASGAEALFSFFPPAYTQYRLPFALLGIIFLTVLNMRGVKESIMFLLPIFLLFLVTHLFAILYSIFAYSGHFAVIGQQTVAEVSTIRSNAGILAVIFLILQAYGMGAGTYTGIEAVSNGLPVLRDPKVRTGKRTMFYMAASLIFMVLGLILAYMLVDVQRVEGKTLNAVLFEQVSGNWNGTLSGAFVLVTLFAETALLFVAAQAGFIDGPRVLANMALDRWFPSRFANLSDRLVTQNGILLMGAAAFITVLVAEGSVETLLTLYSITVFITFVLSQLGMVKYWLTNRSQGRWKKGLAINAIGLVLCLFILISIAYIKIEKGGWVTLLLTAGLITFAVAIKRHYKNTLKLLKRLDTLVEASGVVTTPPLTEQRQLPCDCSAKTAVILVNGFNGLGLHTLFGVIRMFKESFKNYAFIQVGVIDAGTFKGVEEMHNLQQKLQEELAKYVAFMKQEGFYAESFSAVGTDVVDEITRLVPKVLERFPNTTFFGGQLVFPDETMFTRWLHNHVVFATQRRLYSRGIPFMILPIRV